MTDPIDTMDIQAFAELAERFAAKDLAPHVLKDDAYPFRDFNAEIWRTAGSLGLADLVLPEALGGLGLGVRALSPILEAVARVDGSAAALLLSQALARSVLGDLGPEAAARRALAVTPDGSAPLLASPLYCDPEELPDTLRARRAGEGYRLEGRLDSLACLPVARTALVPAVVDGEGEEHAALFAIDLAGDGLHVGEPVLSLGLRACPVADLVAAGATVPATARLGGDDAAAGYARVAERYRLPLVAVCLGVLRGSYDLALAYALERRQGGKRIVEHDMVRRMLSDMAAWIDLGSAALAAACEQVEQGGAPSRSELLSLQELITRAVSRSTSEGVQVLGGNGYMHDYGQEKRMRDAGQLQAVFGASATRRLRILERRLERAGRPEAAIAADPRS